ncbi:MAG TPA: hypothetical protein VGJ84_01110 [Polyangiaceae bacterium]|jgi:alpha-tubulin suppressor-like RCC1 family protein
MSRLTLAAFVWIAGTVACAIGCRSSQRKTPPAAEPAKSQSHSSVSSSKPQVVVPVTRRSPPKISAGQGGTCAITREGAIYCWGNPLANEPYGTGPRRLSRQGLYEQVAYNGTACGRTPEGEVWCAGFNDHGQLGAASTETCEVKARPRPYHVPCSSSPLRVRGLPTAVDIAVSYPRSCAITTDAQVYCWGDSIALGFPCPEPCGPAESSKAPYRVPGLERVRRLALSPTFACALRDDGTVWCWGSNADGELGRGFFDLSRDGSTGPVLHKEPAQVSGLRGVIDIGVGANHACALQFEGSIQRLYCWGRNNVRQLGVDTSGKCEQDDCSVTPARVPLVPGSATVAALAVAENSSCTLHRDGSLYCWGSDWKDWLGIKASAVCDCVKSPSQVMNMPPLTQVANGGDHLCAVTAEGAIRCWGQTVVRGGLGFPTKAAHCDRSCPAPLGGCDTFCIEPATVVPGVMVVPQSLHP